MLVDIHGIYKPSFATAVRLPWSQDVPRFPVASGGVPLADLEISGLHCEGPSLLRHDNPLKRMIRLMAAKSCTSKRMVETC